MMLHTVNMTELELRKWQKDPRHRLASTKVGWKRIGQIVRLLETPRSQWTEADKKLARTVDNFNKRHLAQRTFGAEAKQSGWSKRAIALRNWGHDPSKKSSPVYNVDRRWLEAHPGARERRHGAHRRTNSTRQGTMAVQPYIKSAPFAARDRRWDGSAAEKRLRKWAGATSRKALSSKAVQRKYAKGFLLVDGRAPENFSSYSYPIADIVNGRFVIVPRALHAADAYMDGARGAGKNLARSTRDRMQAVVNRYKTRLGGARKINPSKSKTMARQKTTTRKTNPKKAAKRATRKANPGRHGDYYKPPVGTYYVALVEKGKRVGRMGPFKSREAAVARADRVTKEQLLKSPVRAEVINSRGDVSYRSAFGRKANPAKKTAKKAPAKKRTVTRKRNSTLQPDGVKTRYCNPRYRPLNAAAKKMAKAHLSQKRGLKAGKFKFGQKVHFDGRPWVVYDWERDAKSPLGYTYVLVKPMYTQIASGVSPSEIKAAPKRRANPAKKTTAKRKAPAKRKANPKMPKRDSKGRFISSKKRRTTRRRRK